LAAGQSAQQIKEPLMFGIGIALAILGAVCLHAAIGTHRAGCERRDSYALAGLGIVAGSGGALLLV
jgi:hypothetical protein